MKRMNKEMLSKKKWAVIGASDKKGSFGYRIFKILQDNGYEVYPVNPRLDEIDGVKVYDDVMKLPEVPDVADFVVNPSIGEKILPRCAEKGIQNIWLQPGARSPELEQIARDKGLNVVKSCVLQELS